MARPVAHHETQRRPPPPARADELDGVVADRPHLPPGAAAAALARCVGRAAVLLARREVRQPRDHVGEVIGFADGTAARVYRETVVEPTGGVAEPVLLVVGFRLRWVRGVGHPLFRAESLLNTPLFVGCPGFVSKLWLAHDGNGVYRGVYQWDGAGRADAYVRMLWWVLALVSVRGSIRSTVVPDRWRDEVLADPRLLDDATTGGATEPATWWRPTGVERRGPGAATP
ncbi:MAG TPA: hypothetical protein VIL36_01410 [Acidimicrobiales bacterium]